MRIIFYLALGSFLAVPAFLCLLAGAGIMSGWWTIPGFVYMVVGLIALYWLYNYHPLIIMRLEYRDKLGKRRPFWSCPFC